MKKISLLFALLFYSIYSNAQIALQYSDTLICPGTEITMCAAFTGEADALNVDDAFSDEVVDLGFTFNFFGTNYTQCAVSGNAYISFDLTRVGQWSPYTWGQLNAAGVQTPSILAAFQDLYLPAGGKLWYQSFGSPGSRRFIVEWCDVPKYGGSQCNAIKVTTQIILYEGSNNIDIITKSLPGSPGCPSTNSSTAAGNAIQGLISPGNTIQMFTPNRGPTDMWGNTGATNDAVRYLPTGTNTYTINTTIPFNPWKIIENANSSLIQWFAEGSNVPLATGACATVTPTTQNYYIARYTGVAGCETGIVSFSDTVHIHYGTSYDTIRRDICAGETFRFFGRDLYQTGKYDTLLRTGMGCDSLITLYLTQNPKPNVTIVSNKNVDFCEGDSYTFRVAGEGSNTYQWYRNNQAITGAIAAIYKATEAGKYYVQVRTAKGCTDRSEELSVKINPNPSVKIVSVSSTNICAEDTVTVKANAIGDGIEFEWLADSLFRQTSGAQYGIGQAIVPTSQNIYVKVYSKNGCSAMDSVYITATPCCDMMAPNAFTPNSDGRNDFFKPVLQKHQKIVAFKVFDRYGKVIFDNVSAKGWDGNYPNGKPAAAGAYMYYINYTCTDGKNYDIKGDVIIIR